MRKLPAGGEIEWQTKRPPVWEAVLAYTGGVTSPAAVEEEHDPRDQCADPHDDVQACEIDAQ